MPRFAVSFVGTLTDEARTSLQRIGAYTQVRGKSPVRVQTSVVEIDAADPDTAIQKVRAAIEPHGGYSGFHARPVTSRSS